MRMVMTGADTMLTAVPLVASPLHPAVLCGGGAVAVLLVFFALRHLRIGYLRRRMEDNGRFLENVYPQRALPELIYRCWEHDVAAYNRARRRWPWRLLWHEARAERFTAKPPQPPRASSLPQAAKPAVSRGVPRAGKRPRGAHRGARPADKNGGC